MMRMSEIEENDNRLVDDDDDDDDDDKDERIQVTPTPTPAPPNLIRTKRRNSGGGGNMLLFSSALLLTILVISTCSRRYNPLSIFPLESFLGLNRYVSNETTTTLKRRKQRKMRVLYIITSLAEYNSGRRSTAAGSDRLQETLIPVLRESVLSMIETGYTVDVYLVCHWKVQPERIRLVRDALPQQVGLDYWDEATPIGYVLEKDTSYSRENTRGLARQHRFVVRDKLMHYDFFVCMEDDMLIKGPHIQHNLKISTELFRLRQLAPNQTQQDVGWNEMLNNYYGPMNKQQLTRIFPGLIRVEVLLDEENYGTQQKTGPIPVDLDYAGVRSEVNASICCHVKNETSSEKMPMSPNASKLFLWETGIKALGIRKMPENSNLGWVLLQRGPNPGKLTLQQAVGDYWAGRLNLQMRKDRRPNPTQGMYVNNQGGWMASRKQLLEWHTKVCPGGFLPPFDPSDYNMDGLDLRNVEYWSGGLSLFTAQHACNMQRIISLNPQDFSKHLIYHSANNKQRQLQFKKDRFVKANHLLGELNAVRKRAEQDMKLELQKKAK